MPKKQKICKDEDPVYRPYQRQDIRKKKRNSFGKLNFFTWTIQEEISYVEFLKNNQHVFIDVKERKKNKVFVAMSYSIKKRGPDQCRSHHQKMSLKYGDINSIIEGITRDKIRNFKKEVLEENKMDQSLQIKIDCKQQSQKIDQDQSGEQINEENIESQPHKPHNQKEQQSFWVCLNQNIWVDS